MTQIYEWKLWMETMNRNIERELWIKIMNETYKYNL